MALTNYNANKLLFLYFKAGTPTSTQRNVRQEEETEKEKSGVEKLQQYLLVESELRLMTD
jgi:hypothetical protein